MGDSDATDALLADLACLELPALSRERPPQFTTLAACKQWLAGIPITNAPAALAQLLAQLDLLNRFPLPLEERLDILEYLRAPCHFVHDACVKRFAAQRPALPLAGVEQTIFDASQTLWRALETGYLHCLHSLLEKSAHTTSGARTLDQAALAATRALTTTLAGYLDHCRLGLIPIDTSWRRLHKTHLIAEHLGASQLAVADKLSQATTLTAQATYVETLLLAAAQPHELRPRQLADVAYWAHRWAPKVALLHAPPEDLRTPPLCLDLTQATPGRYAAPASAATLRWLALGELRKTIKQRLIKLGEGVSPQALKLGKHCVQPACELLLRQVYEDWCKGGRRNGDHSDRNSSDHGGSKDYTLLSSIAAIHYHLSGQLFHPPAQSIYLNKRAHEEIATFGHIATRFEEDKKLQAGYVVEDWRSREESVVAMVLERPLDQAGGALSLDRLVAVRPKDEAGFQLGRLNWIGLDLNTATLRASIRLLPGTPLAVTVIHPAIGNKKAEHARGFCLPAIAGIDQDATLLTPPGWFNDNPLIEIRTETTHRIRLTKLIERGADFERCTYEAA